VTGPDAGETCPVSFSPAAIADILAQADWYELQSNRKLSVRWERAVSATVLRLAKTPQAGVLCTFKAETLRGTRRVPADSFPSHLVFHQVVEKQIHILRVVHGARDLEKLFS
jgi:toxin ParE1/3/4